MEIDAEEKLSVCFSLFLIYFQNANVTKYVALIWNLLNLSLKYLCRKFFFLQESLIGHAHWFYE